jgi:hypothetical protein
MAEKYFFEDKNAKKMSPYERQLYIKFGLTTSQAKSIAKLIKKQPSLRVTEATTQVRKGGMTAKEGKRTTPQQQAERSRTVARVNKKRDKNVISKVASPKVTKRVRKLDK